MSDLARHVGVSCAAITGIADVLEISGLLGRHRHRSDRRLVYVHLTEKGILTVSDILNA
jgi:DNA-binding MarR family transcriptional regulator